MDDKKVKKTSLSNNYNYCIVEDQPGVSYDIVEILNNDVMILPFETDGTGNNIMSLYLFKYFDTLKNETKVSTMIERSSQEDDVFLNTVYRAMIKNMNVPVDKMPIDKIFYLGNVDLNNYISGKIMCYAVNVTDYVSKKETSFAIYDDPQKSIVKVNYTDVLRGATYDYLAMSAVFMLLSYFSSH